VLNSQYQITPPYHAVIDALNRLPAVES
jgi:hypothetical protein